MLSYPDRFLKSEKGRNRERKKRSHPEVMMIYYKIEEKKNTLKPKGKPLTIHRKSTSLRSREKYPLNATRVLSPEPVPLSDSQPVPEYPARGKRGGTYARSEWILNLDKHGDIDKEKKRREGREGRRKRAGATYKTPVNATLTPTTRPMPKKPAHACIQLQTICLSERDQVDQYRLHRASAVGAKKCVEGAGI